MISESNTNPNSLLDILGPHPSQLIKSIWVVIYLIYILFVMGQYLSILIFVLSKFDKK